MKQLIFIFMLLFIFLLVLPAVVSAQSGIKLFVDGNRLQTDVQPRIVEGTTLVPIRIIAEELGCGVSWNHKESKVTVNNEGLEIQLYIDKKIAEVNGRSVSLIAAPIIVDNTTLLPLRFISEQMGELVSWDSMTKTVHVYKQEKKPEGSPVTPDNSGASGEEPGDKPVPESSSFVRLDGVSYIHSIFAEDNNIVIQSDGNIEPKHFYLQSPERIVLDLPLSNFLPEFVASAAIVNDSGEITVDHPDVLKIRYSMHSVQDSTVRVVIDLRRKLDYTVRTLPDLQQIAIELKGNVSPAPDKVYKVVIDAGHGGKDPGASGSGSQTEKKFTISVAQKVNKLLEKEPKLQAIMTRTGDTYLSLSDRTKLANNAKADLFISIHANSLISSKATGTETYYWRPDSKNLAYLIHNNLVKAIGLPDRQVRKGNFHVIRQTTMPAVLLEIGYLSNSVDAKLLFNDAFQQRVAISIVLSIKQYFQIK